MNAPFPPQFVCRFFTQGGTFAPLAGGWLYFYVAGSSTAQSVYADAACTIPLANPLQLDGYGQASFYLLPGASYKINLLDQTLAQQSGFPVDNISTAQGLSVISPVTGTANALAMTVGAASVYTSGLYIAFTPQYNNTSAVTINAGGGVVNLTRNDGTALSAGDLVAGNTYTALYNASSGAFNLCTTVPSQIQGYVTATQLYTTGGTAPNYTITPTPACTAYLNGLTYNLYVGAAGSTGSNTLNVSGLGTKTVYQQGIGGAAGVQPGEMPLGAQLTVQYSTTLGAWVITNPIPNPVNASGRAKNLVVTYSQSSASFTITADEVTVADSNGNQTRLTGINLTVSAATAAAAGTSGYSSGVAGSYTAGNWYPVFISYNPTTAVTIGLIDSGNSGNQPNNPVSGYTQNYLVDMGRMNASSAPWYWYPRLVNGRDWQYVVGTYLTTAVQFAGGKTYGSPSTPTWSAQQVQGNGYPVSPLTNRIRGYINNTSGTSGSAMVAPNASYGAYQSQNMPQSALQTSYQVVAPFDYLLESNSLQIASNNTGVYFICLGGSHCL